MNYAGHVAPAQTPQTEPLWGTSQIANQGGGFGWAADDWARLTRFLILGSEGGSYYVGERALTQDNARVVLRCLAQDAPRTLQEIHDVSVQGRAPKNDPAIFALALCVACPPTPTIRHQALALLPDVCRIGTHLFYFLAAYTQLRGHGQRYGRSLRRALGAWYTSKRPETLALDVLKYRSRHGWTHRDVLAVCHPKPPTTEHQTIFQWISWSNLQQAGAQIAQLPPLLAAYEQAQHMTGRELQTLISMAHLPREALPTESLISPQVWEALLDEMPMTALIRNLATMTRVGTLRPLTPAAQHVVQALGNSKRLHQARIHPIQLLAALIVYGQGHGMRNVETRWEPVGAILDALDHAFYATLAVLPPSTQRLVVALDVSGSMSDGEIAGVPGLSPRVASAALALVFASQYPQHVMVGFSKTLIPLAISPRQRLDDVVRTVTGLPFGATDCALPVLWAMQQRVEADAFIVLTDSETNTSSMHPAQALREYRAKTGIKAKLVVVGMVANNITIADPADMGMLDVVGFDTATPQVLDAFLRDAR